MIVLTLFCGAALFIFFKLTGSLHRGALVDFDDSISTFVFGKRDPLMTSIMKGITEFGNLYVYLAGVPIIFFSLYGTNRHWHRSIEAVVIVLSSFLLNTFLKLYFVRPRPSIELRLIDLSMESYSYPSGHSMTAIVFYGFIIYLVIHYGRTKWVKYAVAIVLSLVAVLVGISRIYLGAHYPSDVLAGFAAGLFWLLFVIGWLRYRRFKALG